MTNQGTPRAAYRNWISPCRPTVGVGDQVHQDIHNKVSIHNIYIYIYIYRERERERGPTPRRQRSMVHRVSQIVSDIADSDELKAFLRRGEELIKTVYRELTLSLVYAATA